VLKIRLKKFASDVERIIEGVETISKIGYWFNLKAGPGFSPQAY
jgi:hypothetical protein